MTEKRRERRETPWKRVLLAGAVAAALAGGCWGGGYLHTHPHLDTDGKVRTHRHWHADAGFAGHHEHPFPNQKHKDLAWSD